ncbi:MAG: hypothetical protein HKN24_00765, partial [Acidimicrobiales bacterium]|nr:hypothetical protein [Acidimicrobiales bacterium]
GQTVSHPGILISGENPRVEALRDIELRDNVVVDSIVGLPFRTEGQTTDVSNHGLSTDSTLLPTPLPTAGTNALAAGASTLRTWDTSFVAAEHRRGLYRIHVRERGDWFDQSFEYVVAGPDMAIDAWLDEIESSGSSVNTTFRGQWTADPDTGHEVAVVQSAHPMAVPTTVEPVTFDDIRQADLHGSGNDLWRILN